jgi:hypothetical protein
MQWKTVATAIVFFHYTPSGEESVPSFPGDAIFIKTIMCLAEALDAQDKSLWHVRNLSRPRLAATVLLSAGDR